MADGDFHDHALYKTSGMKPLIAYNKLDSCLFPFPFSDFAAIAA